MNSVICDFLRSQLLFGLVLEEKKKGTETRKTRKTGHRHTQIISLTILEKARGDQNQGGGVRSNIKNQKSEVVRKCLFF